jgi:hypothetical protein
MASSRARRGAETLVGLLSALLILCVAACSSSGSYSGLQKQLAAETPQAAGSSATPNRFALPHIGGNGSATPLAASSSRPTPFAVVVPSRTAPPAATAQASPTPAAATPTPGSRAAAAQTPAAATNVPLAAVTQEPPAAAPGLEDLVNSAANRSTIPSTAVDPPTTVNRLPAAVAPAPANVVPRPPANAAPAAPQAAPVAPPNGVQGGGTVGSANPAAAAAGAADQPPAGGVSSSPPDLAPVLRSAAADAQRAAAAASQAQRTKTAVTPVDTPAARAR